MAIIRANNNTLSSVTTLPSGVGGNLVLVTDSTISDGDTSVVFGPLTTYDKYVIDFIDVNHSTDAGAILQAQFGTDASTFNSTSNYSLANEVMVFDDASAVDFVQQWLF